MILGTHMQSNKSPMATLYRNNAIEESPIGMSEFKETGMKLNEKIGSPSSVSLRVDE